LQKAAIITPPLGNYIIDTESTDFDTCSNHLAIFKEATLFYADRTGHVLKRGLLGSATSLEIKTEQRTSGQITYVNCDERYLYVGLNNGQLELFDAKSFESVYSTNYNIIHKGEQNELKK